MDTSNTQGLWATPETAAYLKLSERYVEGLRLKGGGPRFLQFGRAIRYRPADVVEWALSRAKRSTSSEGVAA